MKKLLSILMAAALMAAGCSKYDDSEIRGKMDSYESRIKALETSVGELGTYQALLAKLSSGQTVTSFSQSEEEITLSFSDGGSVSFNRKGPKGDRGDALTWDSLTQAQKDALKGAAGENGKTPAFKIENETWKVSYDGGATWTEIGSAVDRSLIKDIAAGDDMLVITLADGSLMPLPRAATLEIVFAPAGKIALAKGEKKEIRYSVTSSKKPVAVTLSTSSDIRAKVTPSDADGLAGTITLEATADIDEYSRVVVIADNGSRTTAIPLALRSTNGHEYVDLGLPSGLKWATMNVGATKPEEYGDYFAWGETSTKNNYSWSSYKWCNGSSNTLTKYNTNSSHGSVVDSKTTLDLEDDAARANWGGSWRMPTRAEFDELINNCTSTWTQEGGVNGRKFTSTKNGNSIFLPAAGLRNGASLLNAGTLGYFWSSSLNTGGPRGAWDLYFYSGNAVTINNYRLIGYPVRPVTE